MPTQKYVLEIGFYVFYGTFQTSRHLASYKDLKSTKWYSLLLEIKDVTM